MFVFHHVKKKFLDALSFYLFSKYLHLPACLVVWILLCRTEEYLNMSSNQFYKRHSHLQVWQEKGSWQRSTYLCSVVALHSLFFRYFTSVIKRFSIFSFSDFCLKLVTVRIFMYFVVPVYEAPCFPMLLCAMYAQVWQCWDIKPYLVTESFNLSCIIASFEFLSTENVTSGCHKAQGDAFNTCLYFVVKN